MRLFPPVSPCPEDHIDPGRIEHVINAARHRLGAGMDEAQCHAELVAQGVTADDADQAMKAALILLGAA